MPPGFEYPVGVSRPTEIWVPYVVPANQQTRDPSMHVRYLQVIARLKTRVSLAEARTQMSHVADAIEAANPVWNKDSAIGVRPLVDHIVGARIRSWMLLLLGAVGAVLLIACANIANLLLARASAQERDLTVRAALGASRWRLVRQLLTESVLLSFAGTACAILVAWWAVGVLRTSMPDGVPRVTGIALDLRVLSLAAGLSILTGIVAGLIPALQLSKPELAHALKAASRGSAGTIRHRTRSALVIAEVALAVVLLVSAALFIGSFMSLMRIDPGFDPDNVLTAQISPRIENPLEPPDLSHAFADLLERIQGIPGVTHASMVAHAVPLGGGSSSTTIRIPGKPDPNADGRISIRRVTPGFFQALSIPLKRGRVFSDEDRRASPAVMIINESAARKFFAGEEPVGRTARVYKDRSIVGIVGDIRQVSLETEPVAEAYLPFAQESLSGGELAVRTAGDPYAILPAVRAALHAVLPDVPLRNVRTMDELVARRAAQRRLSMLLLGLFGLLGLTIAAVGVYGVMATVVSARTREIGVRIALGATRGSVVGMVLRSAGALVVSGLLIGGIAAWYLSAVSRSFLFRLEPTDPRAFAAAVVCLLAAALVASAIPALRAARVDPMVALRAE